MLISAFRGQLFWKLPSTGVGRVQCLITCFQDSHQPSATPGVESQVQATRIFWNFRWKTRAELILEENVGKLMLCWKCSTGLGCDYYRLHSNFNSFGRRQDSTGMISGRTVTMLQHWGILPKRRFRSSLPRGAAGSRGKGSDVLAYPTPLSQQTGGLPENLGKFPRSLCNIATNCVVESRVIEK